MEMLSRLACLGFLMLVAGQPRPPRVVAGARAAAPTVALRSGDIVFQDSGSSRSALIRKASHSGYSHVGLVEVAGDGVFVLEAVQPVSRTPLDRWVARGVGRKVTLARSALEPAALAQVVAFARRQLGKPYDARYRWDDERLYCSELVRKAFQEGAGLTLGREERVDELALGPDELALAPSLGISLAQTLVTPGSIAEDPQLTTLARDVAW